MKNTPKVGSMSNFWGAVHDAALRLSANTACIAAVQPGVTNVLLARPRPLHYCSAVEP